MSVMVDEMTTRHSTTPHSMLFALLLLVGTLALYLPSVHFDFTLDDPLLTTLNQDVVDFRGNYGHFFTTNLFSGTSLDQENSYLYRPLLKLSISLNYQIAGYRFHPYAFHLTNIILYGICVVVVFYLIHAMSLSLGKRRLLFAFLAALLFMVFPSHLESVCNIKHREEIMACLFGLLSWQVVLRDPGSKGTRILLAGLIAPLLFLLALLTKESAILLFPCMILWDIIRKSEPLQTIKRPPLFFYTFSLAILIYLAMRYNALGSLTYPAGTRTFFGPDEGLLTRLLVSSRIFVEYYLWDQLVTHKLNPLFSSRFLLLDSPSYFLHAPALIVLCGALILSLWRVFKTGSIYAFWVLFFFMTSVLTLNILPIGTAGAFRLMFTPSLALCVLLLLSLRMAARRISKAFKLPDRASEIMPVVLAMSLAVFYGYRAYKKIPIWENNGALFSYSVIAGPNNPISHFNAGQYYGKAGIMDQKLKFYASSLELFMARKDQENLFEEKSRDAFSVAATEIAFSELNRNPQKAIELADVAIEQFQKLEVLRDGRIDTNVAAPYYVKALAFKNLGDIEKSIQTCHTALAITYHRGIDQLLRSMTAVP
jgi:tetratricopeptide (TPR) repeat protein